MNRVNQILCNIMFKDCMQAIDRWESQRIFCKHDLEHVLSVCRIAYILNLEEGSHFPKELIYGAGLLHDIGKHEQYQKQLPHQEASAVIAKRILVSCGYTGYEIEEIVSAILTHRSEEAAKVMRFNHLLYRADKMSRTCYNCLVEDECDWDDNKKNMHCII